MIILNKIIYKIKTTQLYNNWKDKREHKRAGLLITNVFNKNNSKHVLVSYITHPFTNGINLFHTNVLECLTACEIFDKLNYNVDVINYDAETKINYSKYTIIYGFGTPFENSYSVVNTSVLKRIVYSPGCNTVFSNAESSKKIHEFLLKTKYLQPNLARFANNAWPLQKHLSNLIICLGNNFVENTYKKENSNIKTISLPAFYHKEMPLLSMDKKNFLEAKKNVLWFGSAGSLHKGLDVFIELSMKFKNITFHIAGYNYKNEPQLLDYYKSITPLLNVINHGFVNIKSNEFIKLMNTCGAVINPSVSEGGSPAMLAVMASGGLFPITTIASGVTLNDFFLTTEISTNAFAEKLNNYFLLNESDYEALCKQVASDTRKNYSYETYCLNLNKIITNIIN